MLYPRALAESERVLAAVRAHPGVESAMLAGSLRRRNEIVRDIDVVAACSGARARGGGVRARARRARGGEQGERRRRDPVRGRHGARPALRGAREVRGGTLARDRQQRARARDDRARRGARAHLVGGRAARRERHAHRGSRASTRSTTRSASRTSSPSCARGAARSRRRSRAALPTLIEPGDIRGVLHCHSDYSDGKATIAEMAAAARALGWTYIGISDHSQSAFYAGGLKPDAVLAQHEEIDRLNSSDPGCWC